MFFPSSILWMILLQGIWASSYVVIKLSMAEIPLGLVLILRYGIASLAFLLAGQFRFKPKFTRKEWALLALTGIINFSFSPYFQLKSLTLTRATDVSVLVAFEPIISALMALFFLKEKLKVKTVVTFLTATVGVIIMSGWRPSQGGVATARLMGNAIFFLALICEGVCTITAKHMVKRHSPFRLIAWMILFGFVANLAGNAPLLVQTSWAAISVQSWAGVVYLSLFCTTIGYCGWVALLKRMPVNRASLSLFLQPVFGIFLATLILSEPLDAQTVAGALIVLVSLLIWLVWSKSLVQKPEIQQGNEEGYEIT